MAVELDIQVDTADVSRLLAAADRNRAVLGKGMRESIQWAGVMLAKSLAARTKVSAKKREVVDMPIQRVTKAGEVDRRYAPWGFKKWVTRHPLLESPRSISPVNFPRFRNALDWHIDDFALLCRYLRPGRERLCQHDAGPLDRLSHPLAKHGAVSVCRRQQSAYVCRIYLDVKLYGHG